MSPKRTLRYCLNLFADLYITGPTGLFQRVAASKRLWSTVAPVGYVILAARLADVVKPIQITAEIADDIAKSIRSSGQDTKRSRTETLRLLDQRRPSDDVEARSELRGSVRRANLRRLQGRKSKTWEAELAVVDGRANAYPFG